MSNYFAIEGPDFSGKSTYINKLKNDKQFKDVVFVQEPLGDNSPDFCKDVTEVIYKYDNLTDYQYNLLFTASRIELYNRVIRPALQAGKTVISDRSLYSTFAYNYTDDDFDNKVNSYISTLKNNIPDYVLPTMICLNPDEELRNEHMKNRGVLNHLDNSNQSEVRLNYHKLLNNDRISSVFINYDNDKEGYHKFYDIIKKLNIN